MIGGDGAISAWHADRTSMALDSSLYLITDRRQVLAGRTLIDTVHAALEGGVRAVQLREKDLSARDLYPLARELRALTRRFGARLLINDRIDVAEAVGADGVHLGGGSLPVTAARRLLGPDRLIGVSTHSLLEIREAQSAGADFATFGPVYFTPSKAPYGAPLGVEALRAACASTSLPIFALGGIKETGAPEVVGAGAFGIALISAILASPDPASAAAAFLRILNDK